MTDLNDRRFIASATDDHKAALVLARLEERMDFLREEAADRKRQMEMHTAVTQELRDAIARMSAAVDRLTDDVKLAERIGDRCTALETEMAAWRPAMKRWQEIHDTFVSKALGWLFSAAVSGGGAALMVTKLFDHWPQGHP